MAIKMRVLYLSGKSKMKAFAEKLCEGTDVKADTVPPAYNVERTKLLIVGVSLGGSMNVAAERFFTGLDTSRATNVAFFVDGSPEKAKKLMDMVAETGVNVIDDVLYVKGGLPIISKPSAAEYQTITEWANKIIASLS